MALDLALPREPGDDGAELTRADLGPGAVLSCVSLDERSGKLAYPEICRRLFAHSEVLERIRSATFGNTPKHRPGPGQDQPLWRAVRLRRDAAQVQPHAESGPATPARAEQRRAARARSWD